MKKGQTRNSQTENTIESISHERDNSAGKNKSAKNHGVTSLNLNSVESNVTTGLDSAHEKKLLKPSKKQDSLRGSDIQHLKLINYIRETFLDIRQKTIDEVITFCHFPFIYCCIESKHSSILEKFCSL